MKTVRVCVFVCVCFVCVYVCTCVCVCVVEQHFNTKLSQLGRHSLWYSNTATRLIHTGGGGTFDVQVLVVDDMCQFAVIRPSALLD